MFTMLLLSCDLLHLLFLFYNPLYIYKKGICPKTCTFINDVRPKMGEKISCMLPY